MYMYLHIPNYTIYRYVYKVEAGHDECGRNEDETMIMTVTLIWSIVSVGT